MIQATLVLPFVFSSFVFAGPRTAGVLTTEMGHGQITARVKDGFHFNAKAPNGATVDGQSILPVKVEAKVIEITGLPAKFKEGHAQFYICDDEVTFCETQTVPLNAKGGAVKAGKVKSTAAGSGKVNKHGFIEDDFNKALELAKTKKQMVLIDFGARWCPACIRLESEMFDSKEFKELTKDYVKLKLDTDRFQNVMIAEKFNVKGIPTMLVINVAQEEIDRFVDFQPLEVVTAFFSSIKEDPTSLKQLQAAAASEDAARLRLGKRLEASGQAAEAVLVLEKIKPAPAELLDARVDAAKARYAADKNQRRDYILTLKDAVKAAPDSLRSVAWPAKWSELVEKPAEKAKLRQEGVAVADAMLSDPEKLKAGLNTYPVGEFTGFERMVVGMERADLIEMSGAPPAEIEEGNARAADLARDSNIPLKNVGLNLRYLNLLIGVKRFEEADALTRRLVAGNPGNPELERRRLRVLLELKRYDEVIKLGKKVIGKSYGRNEFYAAEVVGKAYVESKKKEARSFIERYLSRSEMEWPNMKAARAAFQDMLKRIDAEKI